MKGFTLIELLLSLTLIAGLSVLGVQAFSGYLTRVQIANVYDTLEADLYQAQRFAQEERKNASWGVYFDWSNSQYHVYQGVSYDTRVDVYKTQSMNDAIQATSLIDEVNFVKGQGYLRGEPLEEDIIFSQGTVERRLRIDNIFNSALHPDRQTTITEDYTYYPGGLGNDALVFWMDSTNSQSYKQGNTWFDLYGENHGIVNNQPRYVSDSGGVLDFNANNETYISIKQGHSIDFTQDESITVMMGIQSDSNNTSEGWIFNFGDWDIFVNNDNSNDSKFISTVPNQDGNPQGGETSIDLGQWVIAGVGLDQSETDLNMDVYKNGKILEVPDTLPGLAEDDQETVFFGSNKDQDLNRFFDGHLNPLIGYKRILNSAEHEILNAYMALTVEDASVTELFGDMEDFGSATHELIGIGKKNDEEVTQSASSGGLSLDASSTSMNNNDMVLATHSNGPLTLTDIDSHKRLERVWKIHSYNFLNKNIDVGFEFQDFDINDVTVDLIRSDTEDFQDIQVVAEDIYNGSEISTKVETGSEMDYPSQKVDGFYTLRFRWE